MSAIKTFFRKYRQRKIKNKKTKELNQFRNALASCGDNLMLFGTPEITGIEFLSMGNDCKINSGVYINARSSVTIGDDVTLSHGAKIISTGYDIENWINNGIKTHINNAPIHIGNHCWVGANAIILPGVKITGEYVVIGAGAVVTKDITESKVIVAGVPAKTIKKYN
ncbi:MAG: acyltransferase [Ruminococcaceae bacterium]|nr:acyltransferase [Oscillospiraceae bacterium]